MAQEKVEASKFLSFVLRHNPVSAGLTMDAQGWVSVEALVQAADMIADRTELETIVRDSGKQRFAFSEDGQFIRANQGHSLPVDLGLSPATPPDLLFHGTSEATLPAILAEGLRPMGRQYVHLSSDVETARAVGMRHGKPVVLQVASQSALDAGHSFYLSVNRVWLVDAVPASALSLL